jgi:hypothetical protein
MCWDDAGPVKYEIGIRSDGVAAVASLLRVASVEPEWEKAIG